MDPASMMLAALFLSAVITRLPQALADHHEAKKAAQAGEWGHLRDMRGARDTAAAARADRRQRWAERLYDDWQARDRGEKRPGFWAWLSEVWHGAWEDALERRTARRGVRPGFDPGTPTLRDRAWAWGRAKADRWRRKKAAKAETWPKPVDAEPESPFAGRVLDEPEPKPWRQKCLWQVDGYGCGADAVDGDIYCPPHVAEADRRPTGEDQQEEQVHGAGPEQAATDGPDSTGNTDGGPEMTAPTATAEEVHTNEAARRSLERIEKAAADLAEAAAQAEAAKAVIVAEGAATGDAMSVKSFDQGATQSVAHINDIVNSDNLSAMSAAADEIGTAAKKGLKDLEKYKDSENLIVTEKVDPTTMAPTQS